MIYLILFLMIVFAAFFHAVGDSIKDIKTHFGDAGDASGRKGHPYRDFFHLVRLCERAALILTGYVIRPAFADPWAASLTIACALVIGRLVWERVYACPDYWLAVDETVKMGTGWKWLDKLAGFHW